MSSDLNVRFARANDLPALVAIYNHYIETTPITFDTTSFSVSERQSWFDSFSESGPHWLLIAEADEKIVGYASSSEFKSRVAYDTSVETSIYLDPDNGGNGVGTTLYGELLRLIVDEPRLHRAYGVIALPNEASVALHQKFGFVNIGTFSEVGFKFDRYWDVAWFEKDLSA